MTDSLSALIVAAGGSLEASILIKITLAAAIGLLATRLARRARASTRHLILASTLVAVTVLPLAALVVPDVTITLLVPGAGTAGPGVAAQADAPEPGPVSSGSTAPAPGVATPADAPAARWSLPAWPAAVRAAWVTVAVLLLGWLAAAVWRFDRLRRRGLPWPESRPLVGALSAAAGLRRPVDVVLHEHLEAPATCGVLRPTIVLPPDARDWSAADLRRAFVHELEHVRRRDWAVHLLARATCAVFWFHPLVWAAYRQLGLEAERACDDAVLEDAERTDYADQLVQLARRLSQGPAQPMLAMANRSDLAARVAAILDSTQPRGRLRLVTAAVSVSATVMLAASAASVRAVGVDVAGPATAEARPAQPAAPEQTDLERSEPASSAVRAESGGLGDQPRPNRSRGWRRGVTRLDEALYEAAEAGDLDDITAILNAGANVNAALDGDGSPLIGAARNGRLAAVRLLLSHGADTNQIVLGDGTALIMAAREGHADIVNLLLDHGASIDLVAPGDENPLIQAAWEGRLAVVKLLVTRGANVNARVWVDESRRRGTDTGGEWRTPLAMAEKGGHVAVVEYLRSVGARE